MRNVLTTAIRRVALCAVLGVMALPGALYAFEARMELSPDVLRMGESAQLRIVLEGVDRGPQPDIPHVSGLRISGPALEHSVSMSTVNGRTEQRRTLSYRYTVIPLQPGEYTVGPVSYTYDNETVTMDARTLRVVLPSGEQAGNDSDVRDLSDLIFATLTANKERIYANETFELTLSVYSRGVNLGRDISLVNMPDSGIQTQPFEELRTTREIVRGNVYDVRRYRARIRPITSGTLRFAPQLRVQVLVERSGRRHPFHNDPFFGRMFSNMEAHPFDMEPDPLTLRVESLPEEGRPAYFTGGVGQFRFSVDVQPTEVRPGDPITITMQLMGDGNIDAVGAPSLAESELFRVYPPRVVHSDTDQNRPQGRKVYEQVVIPRSTEANPIPPLAFSYFDPEEERYKELVRGPFELALQETDQAESRTVRADTDDEQTRIVGQDIAYLKTVPDQWHHIDQPRWYLQPAAIAIHALPPFLVLTAWLAARRRRLLRADVARARRYRAPRSARAGIREAERGIKQDDVDTFFNGLWTALRSYFGDRLNLPSGAVTIDEVLPHVKGQGLDDETLAALTELFQACDAQRFARQQTPPDEMERLLSRFRTLLKSCERIRI